MKRMSVFLWVCLCSSVLFSLSLAAQTVVVPDTTVQRGSVFPLRIQINSVPVGDSVRLLLSYDRSLLLFMGAEGGREHIMQCAKPNTFFTNEGTLSISCSSLTSSSTGTLVTLMFEALAGRDNMVVVTPVNFIRNGLEAPNVGKDEGVVTILGEPVIPQPIESISYNYPNPFGEWTKFSYSVTGDTSAVQFLVYTLGGRKVPSDDYSIDRFDGVIEFKPKFNLANGSYLMQMRTRDGVYQVPFFFIR